MAQRGAFQVLCSFLMLSCVSIFAPSAMAVETRYCPDYISLSFSDLESLPRSELSEGFWSYAERDSNTMDTYEFMLFVKAVKQRLKLVSKRDAKCYYSRVGGYTGGDDKTFLAAIIRGTHSEPVLQVFASIEFEWEGRSTTGRSMLSYLSFADVESYTRSEGVVLRKDEYGLLPSPVYTSYEKCSGARECDTEYELLGSALIETQATQ